MRAERAKREAEIELKRLILSGTTLYCQFEYLTVLNGSNIQSNAPSSCFFVTDSKMFGQSCIIILA